MDLCRNNWNSLIITILIIGTTSHQSLSDSCGPCKRLRKMWTENGQLNRMISNNSHALSLTSPNFSETPWLTGSGESLLLWGGRWHRWSLRCGAQSAQISSPTRILYFVAMYFAANVSASIWIPSKLDDNKLHHCTSCFFYFCYFSTTASDISSTTPLLQLTLNGFFYFNVTKDTAISYPQHFPTNQCSTHIFPSPLPLVAVLLLSLTTFNIYGNG